MDRAALSFYQKVRDESAERIETLEIEEAARFVAPPEPAPPPDADQDHDSEAEWDAIVANYLPSTLGGITNQPTRPAV